MTAGTAPITELRTLDTPPPGPAFWAPTDVSTKIPVPMMQPTPNKVSCTAPRDRWSDFFSAVARIASSGLTRPNSPPRGAEVAIDYPFMAV